jgi:hypothetical protein
VPDDRIPNSLVVVPVIGVDVGKDELLPGTAQWVRLVTVDA